MSASFLCVHSWDEKIGQTRDENGLLTHFWTGGKSKYHQHIYTSFGLGCNEDDCEMNHPESQVYQDLRKAGY